MTSEYRQESIRALSQLGTMMHMGGSRDMSARLQHRSHVLEISALAEELEAEKSRMEVLESEELDRRQQDAWYANELKHRGGSGVESPYAHHHQAPLGGGGSSPRLSASARRHYRTANSNNVSFSSPPTKQLKRDYGASPNNSTTQQQSHHLLNRTTTTLKGSYGIRKSPSDAAQAIIRASDPRTSGPAAHAIETQISLVETYAKTGRLFEAIDLMRRALSNYEDKVCRGNLRHPALLPILIRLASLVEESGDKNEARCIRDRIRHIGQDVIGITNDAKFAKVINGEQGLLDSMGGSGSYYPAEGEAYSPVRRISTTASSASPSSRQFNRNGSYASNQSSGSFGSPSSFRGGGGVNGDASPGSVARSRNRNVFSYSFLSDQQ